MVCKEYKARISALIDNELTAGERIEVLEHLDHCPACKAYWDDLLALRDAVRAQGIDAPAGFADAVMARVRETKQDAVPEKKVLRFPQWRRFAALAACCALVMLGIWSMDLIPGMENSMDMAMTNGCAVPERAAQADTMTGSVWTDNQTDCATEMPDADYGVSEDGTSAAYNAPNEPDALPENEIETDDVKTFAQNGDFIAAIATKSDIAGQWVEDHLGQVWISGASYTLSEEQYCQLRDILVGAGEEFTEITGENNGSGYRLLAE